MRSAVFASCLLLLATAAAAATAVGSFETRCPFAFEQRCSEVVEVTVGGAYVPVGENATHQLRLVWSAKTTVYDSVAVTLTAIDDCGAGEATCDLSASATTWSGSPLEIVLSTPFEADRFQIELTPKGFGAAVAPEETFDYRIASPMTGGVTSEEGGYRLTI